MKKNVRVLGFMSFSERTYSPPNRNFNYFHLRQMRKSIHKCSLNFVGRGQNLLSHPSRLGGERCFHHKEGARNRYTPWMLELALREGNAYNSSMQYTLRNIPEALDAALRERSRVSGRSLNEVAVEALGRGLGLSQEALRHRDLKDLAGTWRNDPAFDRAIVDQHAIDDELWK